MSLIEDNMNLVYFLISKYYPSFIHDEDIAQSGMVGLCRAAETWDESKSKFITYASHCILNEVKQEFRNRKRQITGISLNQDMCENGTFAEALVGDEDVNFIDYDGFYNELTARQKEIWRLIRNAYSSKDIAEKFGCSKETITKDIRKIKSKWRKFNGNSD